MSGFQSISNFLNAFNGGTRPNRFKISGTNPGGDLFFDTHCSAATLPESIVGIIPVPFRGRVYKFPGDRTYNEWNVTILDDIGNRATWDLFHSWSEEFNEHENNTSLTRKHITRYCADLTVELMDHNSDIVLRTMQLLNAWPVQVGPVTLDMNAANQLGSFQVQIAYTHFLIIPPTSSPVIE
jgi:hypothetical protein